MKHLPYLIIAFALVAFSSWASWTLRGCMTPPPERPPVPVYEVDGLPDEEDIIVPPLEEPRIRYKTIYKERPRFTMMEVPVPSLLKEYGYYLTSKSPLKVSATAVRFTYFNADSIRYEEIFIDVPEPTWQASLDVQVEDDLLRPGRQVEIGVVGTLSFKRLYVSIHPSATLAETPTAQISAAVGLRGLYWRK